MFILIIASVVWCRCVDYLCNISHISQDRKRRQCVTGACTHHAGQPAISCGGYGCGRTNHKRAREAESGSSFLPRPHKTRKRRRVGGGRVVTMWCSGGHIQLQKADCRHNMGLCRGVVWAAAREPARSSTALPVCPPPYMPYLSSLSLREGQGPLAPPNYGAADIILLAPSLRPPAFHGQRDHITCAGTSSALESK
jgi:hypothetical protein